MRETAQALRPLVALIGFLLLIWMLRAAVSVLMPLTVAAIIVMLVWPLQARLERRLPRGLSVAVSLLALLLVFSLLGMVLWFCANAVAAKSAEYQQLFSSFVGRVDTALSQHRIPEVFRHWNPEQITAQVMRLAGSFAIGTYQVVGCAILVIVFVVLLLIEVSPFCGRLHQRFTKERADKLMDVVGNTAASVRRFLLMRTLTSGTTGVLTGLFAWAIGLDLALVWAVIAFILNYVPVFGAIVAVVPPAIVALIEPGRPWLVVVTVGGLSVIHFVVGNYVDPLLQGRYLSLPPLVVFYSLVFWGWVWGFPGALLGVPLTVGIVMTCQHFESTRWVARLLLNH